MRSKSRWPWAMGLGVAVGAVWLAVPWLSPQGPGWQRSAQSLPTGAGAQALADDGDPVPSAAQLIAAMTPDQVRNRLFQEGSFVGTQPAGDWCVTPQNQLQPCLGLRQRIEYYLLGLGEVRIHDVRMLVQDEARQAHGEALSQQIMAVFDQYWKLRTYDWRHQFAQNDRSTWQPVFEEQRTVRRQILGQAWADAFFLDEENHFQAYYAQFEGSQPVSVRTSGP